MDRKTANREWRDVTRGAPEGVPTGRTIHGFAQRVEALAIAGCERRQRNTARLSCWCEHCDMTAHGNMRTRMSVCPECGDKRCPRAAHHSIECSKPPNVELSGPPR